MEGLKTVMEIPIVVSYAIIIRCNDVLEFHRIRCSVLLNPSLNCYCCRKYSQATNDLQTSATLSTIYSHTARTSNIVLFANAIHNVTVGAPFSLTKSGSFAQRD